MNSRSRNNASMSTVSENQDDSSYKSYLFSSKTFSDGCLNMYLSNKAVPIIRFSLKKCHMYIKKSRKSLLIVSKVDILLDFEILISRRTVSVGMRLQRALFFENQDD